MLTVAEPDIQVAASTAFLQILQKELVPVQSYPQMFLQTILNSIDNKDPGKITLFTCFLKVLFQIVL